MAEERRLEPKGRTDLELYTRGNISILVSLSYRMWLWARVAMRRVKAEEWLGVMGTCGNVSVLNRLCLAG